MHPQAAFFGYVTSRRLVYSSCWEDPDVDRQALDLNADDRVLVITSAGCNALDYLLAGAGRVDAVDSNPCQGYLLEFKVAAIRALDYQSFFRIFGLGGCAEARTMYWDAVRDGLSVKARRFWDDNLNLLTGYGWRKTFYHKSTSGTFCRCMVECLYRIKGLRSAIERLLSAADLETQREIYQECGVRAHLDTPSFRWLLSCQAVLSLLAVPPAQRSEVTGEYAGGWASFALDALDTVFQRTLVRHNPFWLVGFTGGYTSDCHPSYLQPQCYEELKHGLLDRLHIHEATITDYLGSEPEGSFSKYVLLDHMDWMSQPGQEAALGEEWSQIARTARRGARVIFRSASANADFLDHVHVGKGSGRRPLCALLSFNRALAQELHNLDRVCIYRSFHIADITPNGVNRCEPGR